MKHKNSDSYEQGIDKGVLRERFHQEKKQPRKQSRNGWKLKMDPQTDENVDLYAREYETYL